MKDSPHLLRGVLLQEAEAWVRLAPKTEIVPDDVAGFIQASERAELIRSSEAAANLEERQEALAAAVKAARRVRAVSFIAAAVAFLFLVGASVAGWFALKGYTEAFRMKSENIAREAKAIFDNGNGDMALSMLMALQADPLAKKDPISRIINSGKVNHFAHALMVASFQTDIQLQTPSLTHAGWILSVAYSPDGLQLATASDDGTVKLWDGNSGKWLRSLSGHDGFVESVSWSQDSRRLASGSYDGKVRVWDSNSGELLQTTSGSESPVYSVAWSPVDLHVASASTDGIIRIWDSVTGDLVRSLEGHEGPVWSVAYSPDGSRLASGSSDQTVRVWNSVTGDLLYTLEGHGGTVWSVAYSPDGRHLASGSSDQTVRQWGSASGKPLLTMSGHAGTVWSVVYSPDQDGWRIASASSDRTVQVWDRISGERLKTFHGHQGFVLSVAYSPDGSRRASASEDGSTLVYAVPEFLRLSPHERVEWACRRLNEDNSKLAFTETDAAVFRVLSDEAKDEEGNLISPCRGYLPEEAFAPVAASAP